MRIIIKVMTPVCGACHPRVYLCDRACTNMQHCWSLSSITDHHQPRLKPDMTGLLATLGLPSVSISRWIRRMQDARAGESAQVLKLEDDPNQI